MTTRSQWQFLACGFLLTFAPALMAAPGNPSGPAGVTPAVPAAALPPAIEAERRMEVERLKPLIQSGTVEERSAACAQLPFSGITDEALFDMLASQLNARYAEAVKTKEMVDVDVSRCVQGLASSGNDKYLPTIMLWANAHKTAPKIMNKYRRKFIAGHAPKLLADSATWNPIIHRADGYAPGRNWAQVRVVNMLTSDDPALQKEGLRRVVHHRKDFASLFDIVQTQLVASYKGDLTDPQREDAVAWFCKSLGQSHDPKYTDTLTMVATGAASEKVRDNAQTGLKILQSPIDPKEEAEKADAELQ